MVIFQYNLYIFVWIYHGCLTNTVYAMDPDNRVIKRLWCIRQNCSRLFLDMLKKDSILAAPLNLKHTRVCPVMLLLMKMQMIA